MKHIKKTYIISALRTAIGNFGGTLKSHSAAELGSAVVSEIVERERLNDLILSGAIVGHVLQAGAGQNTARQCIIGANLPDNIPCFTVNKVCGSSMKAVEIAHRYIQSDCGHIYFAGGIESMSNSPYISKSARWGSKLGNAELTDEMITDGLWCPYNNKHMGQIMEEKASEYKVTRQEQDEFSFKSNLKAVNAIKSGRFKDETVPVVISGKKGQTIFDTDERPREDTSIDKLSSLKPAFSKDGTITAGNSSGINDGAAMLLLASEDAVKKYGLSPLAEIIAASEVSMAPKDFGIAPVQAIKNVLEYARLSLPDISLFEINEAFAAQSLCVLKEIEIDKNLLNVNGGAIALGHPIGASGARIIVTLLHEMLKQKISLGLASLCIGSGEAMAVIIKNITAGVN